MRFKLQCSINCNYKSWTYSTIISSLMPSILIWWRCCQWSKTSRHSISLRISAPLTSMIRIILNPWVNWKTWFFMCKNLIKLFINKISYEKLWKVNRSFQTYHAFPKVKKFVKFFIVSLKLDRNVFYKRNAAVYIHIYILNLWKEVKSREHTYISNGYKKWDAEKIWQQQIFLKKVSRESEK